MSTWIKWWKDKTYIKIWAIILLSMAVSFGIISINADNWLCIAGAVLTPICGGLIIRKMITKKLDEIAERNNDKEA